MKIISYNVNGIRARKEQLDAVLAEVSPDIIGLQETKVVDEEFPVEELAQQGYHAEWFGQKGHYGVALLSKIKPVFVQKGFPFANSEDQRRVITCHYPTPDGREIQVVNAYFPQGENREHPTKFANKRKFYADMQRYLKEFFKPEDHVIVMGDMNVAPLDSDIGIGSDNAKRWLRSGKASFLPEEREWLSHLLEWGLSDSFRIINPDEDNLFSWFDYRSKGFDREPKRGLRIDQILASSSLIQRLTEVGIDYDFRGRARPSDHCFIWANFNFAGY